MNGSMTEDYPFHANFPYVRYPEMKCQALTDIIDSASPTIKVSETKEGDQEDTMWISAIDKEVHEPFLRKTFEVILNKALFTGLSRDHRLNEFKSPEELKEILDLSLRDEGESFDKLLGRIEDVIRYSVKTGHPYFINQLFSSVDPYGVAAQWVTDALNPSVYTYEVAPVFTLMELEVLQRMRQFVGYQEGDGIFAPGGSLSNLYGLMCARYKVCPETKTKGLKCTPQMVIFTSKDAHYSIAKASFILGIGSDNVYKINTLSNGKMDVNDLEMKIIKSIDEGCQPLAVCATAGTTVLGAYDPVDEIATVCEKYNIWLHVDAAWGGGALMSKKYKHLLKGIERSDSATWNPHKLLAVPQQCSVFLTKHTTVLSESNAENATYLFQKDKFYDTSYDLGDRHIQCGRRCDVFKFWLMWKGKGTNGLEKHIDRLFGNAEYFVDKLRQRSDFKLVLEKPECTNVCFWYIPPSLSGAEGSCDYNERLNKIAPKIKERMMTKGSMMITYQPLEKLPNFFRLVLQNSATTREDMDYFINEIQNLGHDL